MKLFEKGHTESVVGGSIRKGFIVKAKEIIYTHDSMVSEKAVLVVEELAERAVVGSSAAKERDDGAYWVVSAKSVEEFWEVFFDVVTWKLKYPCASGERRSLSIMSLAGIELELRVAIEGGGHFLLEIESRGSVRVDSVDPSNCSSVIST